MIEVEKPKTVSPSLLDEERFGIKSAKTSIITAPDIPDILRFCRETGIIFLIARCSTDDFEAVHRMEEEGFKLMDTLVYYNRDITNSSIPSESGNITINPFRKGEEKAVEMVAAKAFRNYFGHYHADPRLDKHKADEVYSSWTMRCCTSPDAADVVLVAKLDETIVGLLALKLSQVSEVEKVGDGLILCVDPSVHGHRISSSLMISGLEWCQAEGANKMKISTQIINTRVQRVWTRLGFEPDQTFYTFHKWFD